ncbi:pilus assembly FimT family protein [Deinococcus pimensis]|uniref:pilus assembly FimT family protein n=1 Tax=Deinococcus pimensis TaxID=309888 RepID=UPI0005EB6F60|nr:prepilin-type N-terminal cleavage/methylation domain-containing protein [Deinococcus pimensis]
MKRGFTLLELILVLAIGTILATLAVPKYLSWTISTRLKMDANIIASAVYNTRMQAKRTASSKQLSTTSGSSSFTAAGVTTTLQYTKLMTTSTLNFNPPYGTSPDTLPIALTVQSLRDSSKTLTVRVVSRMGKVVVQ